jgi:nuclear cap-binding protein subunit 1
LFKLLFKSFADVLNERLPAVSPDGELPNMRQGNTSGNRVAVDLEAPASMDVDQENENGGVNDR